MRIYYQLETTDSMKIFFLSFSKLITGLGNNNMEKRRYSLSLCQDQQNYSVEQFHYKLLRIHTFTIIQDVKGKLLHDIKMLALWRIII